MKILVSETGVYDWHGQVWVDRFRELGVQSELFREIQFFRSDTAVLNILNRFQAKYRLGPALTKLNNALLEKAMSTKANVALLVRGDMIFPETIQRLRDQGVLVLGWNNDDPFSPHQSKVSWRYLFSGLKFYDHYFAYRSANIEDFKEIGCGSVSLLRSSYIRELHFPIKDMYNSPYACDVSFTGHWEADGREHLLYAISNEPRIKLRIFGGGLWRKSPLFSMLDLVAGPIKPVLGADYNLVLNSTRIALVFLSKLNRDTYTRRCFEIPAAGAFMLCEFTTDMASLFKEGVEAEYFRSREELLDKVRFYLSNDNARVRIARAGHEKVLQGHHEAKDRASEIISKIYACTGNHRFEHSQRLHSK